MSIRRTGAVTAVLTGLVVATSGCSVRAEAPEPTRLTAAPEGAPTLPAETPAFTRADLEFSRLMVRHEGEALELAGLVPGRTDTPEVVELAEGVVSSHRSEAERVRGWLEEWGEPVASEPGDGGLGGDGITALREATGTEFDRLWLEAMIAHHERAVALAETAIAGATHRPTLELAEEVVRTRGTEITRMRAMLGM